MSPGASSRPLTIAMVAGEASGDNLGAPLVREILERHPDARLFGVGGPAMIAEGFASNHDIEELSVNGFVDPIMRLPSFLKLLLSLRDQVMAAEADCFVGIDFNFFNLLLEGMLKKKGIRTLHYVSPSVWAWRPGRLEKIARSVDRMLTLYPFEVDVYRQRGIGVAYVGHPRAMEISPAEGREGRQAARLSLGLPADAGVVAMLPGSRAREVQYTGRDFLDTALLLADDVDRFVVPAANEKRRRQMLAILADYPEQLRDRVTVETGESMQVMTAADVVMVNSGTATLEAMLLRRPMITSYRLGPVTYALVSKLLTTSSFALPNILAGRKVVREFIQHDAKPGKMAEEVRRLLHQPELEEAAAYDEIHEQLSADGVPGGLAATAVLESCKRVGR